MASTFVPARAVAQPAPRRRARVSQRLRELSMLLALAAPAALAQQAAPVVYDVDLSNATPGAGDLAADKYAVNGGFTNVAGSATGGSFSLTSGINGMPPAQGSGSDMIFGSGFD